MKRLRVPLLVVLVLIIGFFVYRAFGEEKEVEGESSNIKTETSQLDIENPTETQVPLDKAFEFSFSKELDESTLSNATIKVLNSEQAEVEVGIRLSDDKKTIKILAPESQYKKGSDYELQILEGIKYKNGDPVEGTYNMKFITVRDEVEKAKFNKELIFVEPEQVEAFEGNELTVENSVKTDLAVGDIIIVPSEEYPEGQALKVLELTEQEGMYQLLVEEPDFAELFDELDIYKTYEIKEEHIEIEEGIKGLTVRELAGMDLNPMLASSNGDRVDFEFKRSAPAKGIESINGFELTFKDTPIGKGEDSLMIDGTLSYQVSAAATDMRLGTETRYQLSSISSSVNKFVITPPATEGEGEKTSKKKEKEFKKKNEKIKIAKLKVPTTIPGIFVKGAFYLKLDYMFSYQPKVTVVFEVEEERGVIYDGEKFEQINKFVPKLDASLKGTGSVETSAGAVVNIGVTAYGVVGVGVEAFGGAKGNGEFYTGMNTEYGDYSCYESAFNPVLHGNIFVDVLGDEKYNRNLVKVNLYPKIENGNCIVFQELKSEKKTVKLAAGEKIQLPIKGVYTNLGSEKSKISELTNIENLKVSSADEQVVMARMENGILVLEAADAPEKEKSVVTIEYQEKAEAFEKPIVSILEIPVIIKGFKKVEAEILSEEEYLAIAKDTLDKILGILDEMGERHSLYNEIPGQYSLMETELSPLITEQLVDKKMRDYIEKHHYCDCDLNVYPRIVDTMVRLKVEVIDAETFQVEGVIFGNMHNGSRMQTLEFSKAETEWQLSDWVDDWLENADLELTEEEVRVGHDFSSSEEIVGEYASDDSGGPAYIVAVDGSYSHGIDKRDGNYLFDIPMQEDVQNEQVSNDQIMSEDAELLVRQYLGLEQNIDLQFIYDHDNELGDYVIHVYEHIVDDPNSGAGHTATYGWYGVNPLTGEIYDELARTN